MTEYNWIPIPPPASYEDERPVKKDQETCGKPRTRI